MYDQDRTGKKYTIDTLIPQLSEHATAPIFGIYDSQFGKGVLGGRFSNTQTYAKLTAELTLKLLRGTLPSQLQPPSLRTDLLYDARQLKRWGIPSSRLPKDSRVRFQTPGLFQLYGSWILAGSLFVALQSALLIYLIRTLLVKRKAQRDLQERKEMFKVVFDDVNDGIILADTKDRRIRSANRKMCEMLGYRESELCRLSVKDLHPPEALENVHATFTQQMKGELQLAPEIPMRRKNGSTFLAEINSTPVTYQGHQYLLGVVRNITERKQAEAALQESEEYFRSLFTNMSSGVAVYEPIHDGEDFVFVDMNPSGEKASQVCIEDIRGKRLTEQFPGVEELGLLDCLRQAHQTGEPQFLPISHYKDDRVQEWVENRVFRLPSGRIVAIYDDSTQQHQLEERLRQSEKMDAIGQLAGGIAHDFNNQLSGVLGYADLLVYSLDNEEHIRYAESIKKASMRAAELTQQLLAFGRKGKYLSVPVELHRLIGEVSMMLERSIDKRIHIQQKLLAQPSIINGDPAQLHSVLLNLGINARDAMPKGGDLIYETMNFNVDTDFIAAQPYQMDPGPYVRISVTDNGTGMDVNTSKHVFEPFFTTKEQGKGTGLGLASVYGTIKNHGGAINVYSEVDHGTTFHIYLPQSEEANLDEMPAPVVTRTGQGRLLLVDDEMIVRKLGADLLKKVGYEVISCEDGLEAVDYYREHYQEIDLVILDMVMPGLSGQDTFQAMKRINPHIAAILASGYSLNGEAQAILDMGVLAFLNKPFELTTLAAIVEKALRAPDAGL